MFLRQFQNFGENTQELKTETKKQNIEELEQGLHVRMKPSKILSQPNISFKNCIHS